VVVVVVEGGVFLLI